MNTTDPNENFPENYREQPPMDSEKKRDSRGIIIGVLAIGLAASILYATVSGSHQEQVRQTDQTQISKISDEKSQVQNNFDQALVRLDSLTGYNNRIQASLTDRQKDITKLKTQIRGILKKEHITAQEKQKADSLISDLNNKISGMEQDIARLTQQNQGLTQDNVQLNQDKTKLTSDLQTTTQEKDQLSQKADIASTLFANNIQVMAVQDKKNGEEKITDKAKKADKLKISFDVSNRIAATGETFVYVSVKDPSGHLITDSTMGSGSFTSRDSVGGDIQYSSKMPVEFETGKIKTVNFSMKGSNGFQKGTYQICIYHNGYKIGEASKELKKGGLFS